MLDEAYLTRPCREKRTSWDEALHGSCASAEVEPHFGVLGSKYKAIGSMNAKSHIIGVRPLEIDERVMQRESFIFQGLGLYRYAKC